MKKKKRKSFIKKLLFLIIIIAAAIYFTPRGLEYLTSSKTQRELRSLSYSDDAIKIIVDKKLDSYLIDNKIYSKTLEKALVEDKFVMDYLKYYIDMNYQDGDDFIDNLNSLYRLDYKNDEIKGMLESLSKEDLSTIIDKNEYIKDLPLYIENKYFEIDKLDRYINYQKLHPDYDYNKIIVNVNMYHDYNFYNHDIDVTAQGDTLMIVNKFYKLSSTYVPKGLVKLDAKYVYGITDLVLPVLKTNFDKMVEDMSVKGLSVKVSSAYRSYSLQTGLYNKYVNQSGKTEADTFSARPGYSEHQTGLAVDLKVGSEEYSKFVTTKEYTWLLGNAYKYGFILRYPEGKEDITGYKFESWHYRYVGLEVAAYIYENKITFDEYYAMFIANKKD